MDPNRRLDEFAAHQYGVFSVDQARSAGLTARMMESRINSGAWVRLAPSVYALASSPPKWERQMAAALLTRQGSIAAGPSAAFLHRFDGARPGRPTIMVGIEGNARSPIARVIRSQSFESVERTRVNGFAVTSIPETFVGIARWTSSTNLERIADALLAEKRVRVEELQRLIEVRRGQPGIVKARSVVWERSKDAYQPPMSELERLLVRLLEMPGIPAHVRQRPFETAHVKMIADAYIPAWRLIVEADGRIWHERMAAMERDRRRDNAAVANGYAVLRFTHRMLTDEWDICLRDLRQTGLVRTTG